MIMSIVTSEWSMIETLQVRLPLKETTKATKDYQERGLNHSGSQEIVPLEESEQNKRIKEKRREIYSNPISKLMSWKFLFFQTE